MGRLLTNHRPAPSNQQQPLVLSPPGENDVTAVASIRPPSAPWAPGQGQAGRKLDVCQEAKKAKELVMVVAEGGVVGPGVGAGEGLGHEAKILRMENTTAAREKVGGSDWLSD